MKGRRPSFSPAVPECQATLPTNGRSPTCNSSRIGLVCRSFYGRCQIQFRSIHRPRRSSKHPPTNEKPHTTAAATMPAQNAGGCEGGSTRKRCRKCVKCTVNNNTAIPHTIFRVRIVALRSGTTVCHRSMLAPRILHWQGRFSRRTCCASFVLPSCPLWLGSSPNPSTSTTPTPAAA